MDIQQEEPTQGRLAYYGSILLDSGDDIIMNAHSDLPVTVVRVGQNYEQGYLTLPERGGGYYLETHDTPHLWSHLESHGRGYVLLGKKVEKDLYHVTAFNIPFGKAIYTPGGVIHNDALLIGEILVIYTVTDRYSSVILKTRDGRVPRLKISKSF